MITGKKIPLIVLLFTTYATNAMLVRATGQKKTTKKISTHCVDRAENRTEKLNLVIPQFSCPEKHRALAYAILKDPRFDKEEMYDVITLTTKDLKTINTLNKTYTNNTNTKDVNEKEYNSIVVLNPNIKTKYKECYTRRQPTTGEKVKNVIFETALGAAAGGIVGGAVGIGHSYVNDSIANQQQTPVDPLAIKIEKSFAKADAIHDTYWDIYPEHIDALTTKHRNEQMNKATFNLYTMDEDDFTRACMNNDGLFFTSTDGSIKDILTSCGTYGDKLAHQEAHNRAMESAEICGLLAASTIGSSFAVNSNDNTSRQKAAINGAVAGAAAGGILGFGHGFYTRNTPITTEIPKMKTTI